MTSQALPDLRAQIHPDYIEGVRRQMVLNHERHAHREAESITDCTAYPCVSWCRVQAALKSALAVRETPGWQPRETAPGGGERVLFYIPNPNWAVDGMIVQGFGGDDATPCTLERNDAKRTPSHWMPLPPPPDGRQP